MDLQSEGKSIGESPAARIRSSADQDFNKENFRTEEISAEEEEFIQTHYSPRGVIFLYYKGEASSEVDKHFRRSLAELCCLSGEDEIHEESNIQGEPALPMPQREIPASLWNPTLTSHSQQVETVCHYHCHNAVDVVTISNCNSNAVNSTAANRHVNGSHLFTGQYGSFQQNQPNLIRAVPVSHVSLSVGSFSLGPNQQLPADSSRAPVLPYPYPHKVFAPYYDSHQDSLKFDPRYNPLLVQPEVKPHLPTVPGEPRGKQHGGCEDTTGGLLGEPYIRNGQN
ncbi:transcription cofactor vestigial-like protein 2 [Montipora foliosa]|uniref:transcription cofactor vestigial-like protein 2 n=1 Tax=Montipora foliosa TaxID=591990 RepID=UPI0035F162C1